ncbi:MAG: macro domain-containing protein [Clostridiales bacterium]|nr:macro domain-containing protein [Clostridiales bacterium]
MTFNEVKGDLFDAESCYALCHCISSDIKMGAGVAKLFNNIGVKHELERYSAINKKGIVWYGKGYAIFTNCGRECDRFPNGVFNLVTKQHYYDKPTYETIRDALLDVKYIMIQYHNTTKLAMPRIGCGLDKLQWVFVKEIIKDVFKDTDVDILVFAI